MKVSVSFLLVIGAFILSGQAAAQTTPFEGHFACPGAYGASEIKTADLNDDGLPDLVVTSGLQSVNVFLSNSNGTFGVVVQYPVNGYTYSGELADLNGDTYPDLISSNENDLRVYFNDGSGRFLLDSTYAYDDFSGIAAADYDDDDDLDIIGVGYDQIVFLPNDGDGVLGTPGILPCGAGGNGGIALGDFNKDLLPDFAVAGYATDSLYVFINDGSGSFLAPAKYFAGNYPNYLVIADLNNDTNLDVAITNRIDGEFGVFLGKPDHTLNNRVVYTQGSDNFGIAAADFDEDNYPDLAIGDRVGGRLITMHNNQDGSFTPGDWYYNEDPLAVTTGQFNSDSHTDIAVSTGNTCLRIMFGDGTGLFPEPLKVHIGTGATDFVTGDIDGDDDIDIVATQSGTHSFYVVRNHGDSTFGSLEFTSIGTSIPTHLLLADLDNVNGLDLLTVDTDHDSLYVLFNDGAGNFLSPVALLTGNEPVQPVVGLFDDDAYLDIAVADYSGGSVSVFLNKQDSSFDKTDFVVGDYPQGVAVFDYDGDLDLDLAVTVHSPNRIKLLTNPGTGLFSLGPDLDFPRYPSFITAVDLENDNDVDLLVGADADSLFVIDNYGGSNFGIPRIFPIPDNAYDPKVGDLDDDGDMDILMHFGGYEYVTIMGNNGDGTLGMPMSWYYGDYAADVELGDMNGDGFPDMVVLPQEYNYDSAMFIYWNQKQQIPVDAGEIVPPPQPRSFEMHAYPNPFNPTQTISFTLPHTTDVRLEVFNLLGQKVRTLMNGSHAAGQLRVTWDGKDDTGQALATGIYFYRLVFDGQGQTKKTLLLK